jgi:valyl-tRNA synthetase
MDKAYNPKEHEQQIYEAWEQAGAFKPNQNPSSFTIPIPPPNVTGTLHLGHAIMLVLEDIMIRYHRMCGTSSLWVPGTDHAAIATESVVLKNLEKKSREEFTREEFLEKCWDWSRASHSTITNQIRKMGSSCDWDREAFTFDSERNFAVNYIFKKLVNAGLIERGYRMINWSIGAQSVLADDEVEHKDIKGFLYYYAYNLADQDSALVVATTRPETLFGDTAVAVNPEGVYLKIKYHEREIIISQNLYQQDQAKVSHKQKPNFLVATEEEDFSKKYPIIQELTGQGLVGQKAQIPFSGVEIPVISDLYVDLEFGTGCLKVTPAHDKNDFELGEKHNLAKPQVIGFDGKMLTTELVPKEYQGLTREDCRELLTTESQFFLKKSFHPHSVGICYRSGTIIEPMLSKQWFIMVEKEFIDEFSGEKTTLKKQMQQAVRENHVQIVPERFEKIYFNWIDNLKDWCISRQIWWGHRIPVWYDENENPFFQTEQKLTFARHGEAEGNARGIMQGSTDTELTAKGREQAKELAEKLILNYEFKITNFDQDQRPTKIICSKMKRAQETAEIVAEKLGLEVEVWDNLEEVDAGSLEGVSFKDFTTDTSYYNLAQKIFDSKNKGESFQDFSSRAREALKKLQNQSEENLLIISHGMFLAAIFAIRTYENQINTQGKSITGKQKDNLSYEQFLKFLKFWDLGKAETREMSFLKEPVSSGKLQEDSCQRILLLRHSETRGNVEHLIGTNYPLTQKGVEQTEKLAEKLQSRLASGELNPVKIIASKSQSARETATIIAQKLNLPIEYWSEFSGVDFGSVEGDKGQIGKLSLEIAQAAGTGENPDQVFQRVKEGWKKLQSQEGTGDLIIIAHRTIYSALDLIRAGKGSKEFLKQRAGNEKKPHGIWAEIEISAKANASLPLRQDEDTLDTWFSSALWPFSTLGWPNTADPDYQKFYPTSVLETGHDILFFWVARMIMFGRFATGKYPFHTVYLHGLVCDAEGKKMSKSKGNGIDPLDMIEKYGTDAVRLSLVMGTTPGNNVNLGEDKIAGCRNFCNKLWNISRYILTKNNPEDLVKHQDNPPTTDLQNWLVQKRQKLTEEIASDLENYRFGSASEKLWEFTWNEFADWAVEASKAEDSIETDAQLFKTLKILLELWHPFIPFITEQIWSQCGQDSQIITAKHPKLYQEIKTQNPENFTLITEIVAKIRSLRAQKKVAPAKRIKAIFNATKFAAVIESNAEIIKSLARLESIELGPKPNEKCVFDLANKVKIYLPLKDLIDPVAEKKRLQKEHEETKKALAAAQNKLANQKFLNKAPKNLVEITKSKKADLEAKIAKIESELADFD